MVRIIAGYTPVYENPYANESTPSSVKPNN